MKSIEFTTKHFHGSNSRYIISHGCLILSSKYRIAMQNFKYDCMRTWQSKKAIAAKKDFEIVSVEYYFTGKHDVDAFSKFILDGLQGYAYANDSEVRRIKGERVYSIKKTEEVRIKVIYE